MCRVEFREVGGLVFQVQKHVDFPAMCRVEFREEVGLTVSSPEAGRLSVGLQLSKKSLID